MKKFPVVSLLSIALLASAAAVSGADPDPKAGVLRTSDGTVVRSSDGNPVLTGEQIAEGLKSGELKLESIDADADAAEAAKPVDSSPEEELSEPVYAPGAVPPPPPPPPMPGEKLSIYDNSRMFECSKVELDANKKLVLDSSGNPKYIKYQGNYQSCVFDGSYGERWHALFPGHPARGDQTCEIVSAAQLTGKCITCFPTPETCKGVNSIASLPSANTRGTFDATRKAPYLDAPPSLSLAARIELIKKAKKSIRIQYLIFFGDESGWEIAKLLIKKKQENPSMDIRVNVDTASSFSPKFLVETQTMYFDLKQHGIPVEGFEFAGLSWVNEINMKNPGSIDKRWHDKIFAIDAEDPDNAYAIVGGQNIANEYFRVGTKQVKGLTGVSNLWRDQDVIVHGPIVRDIAKSFDNNFAHFNLVKKNRGKFLGISLNTSEYWQSFMNLINKIDPTKWASPEKSSDWEKAFPTYSVKKQLVDKLVLGKNPVWQLEDAPGISHKVFRLKLHMVAPDAATVAEIRKISDAVDPNYSCSASDLTKLHQGKLGHGCSVIAQLKLEPAQMRWFNQHPRYGETYIMQAHNDLIENAKKSIVIANAYFMPFPDELDARFVQGLKDAAQRCVDVTILTNSAESSDGPAVQIAGRTQYKALLAVNSPETIKKCGHETMAIYEWQGQRHKEYTNHSKFAVFDQEDAIVGSFNLDPRSVRLNSETILVFRNKTVATEMHNQILRYDIGEKSQLVTPAMAEGYSKAQTFKEKFDMMKALLLLNEL